MYWDFVWFHGICIHHVNLTFVLATNKFKKDYRHKVKQTNRSPSFLEDKKTSVMREFTILPCNLEQEWGSPKGRWAGNSYIFAISIALFPMAFGKNFISFGLQSKRPTNICMELCHSHLLSRRVWKVLSPRWCPVFPFPSKQLCLHFRVLMRESGKNT